MVMGIYANISHREGLIVGNRADSLRRYMTANTKIDYLKNVLGIKSIMLPINYEPSTVSNSQDLARQETVEMSFQTRGGGGVLFLGSSSGDSQETFTVQELQLLEKIIVALKLRFEKTSIAKIQKTPREALLSYLQENQFSYIFLLDSGVTALFPESHLNEEVVINNMRLFNTFHPKEMIDNPELKKDAWAGFKKIMENLPR